MGEQLARVWALCCGSGWWSCGRVGSGTCVSYGDGQLLGTSKRAGGGKHVRLRVHHVAWPCDICAWP